ncbi:MAG: toll/interleukin-1 receptor domain-containing protein [Synergistaceae bacterium]|nr:toll/interleukin-1 receptor domain-containing protein [Synergistaceae bacterium]
MIQEKKVIVFVSHSSEDYDDVMKWVNLIETKGLKCWISERDLSDDCSSWPKEIMNALFNSDSVLLYLTRSSADSGQVENEISNASNKGMNVVPLIAEDFEIPDRLKYHIGKYEFIYSYQRDINDVLNKSLYKRLLKNFNAERKKF